jgi:hypothetical protein
MRHVLLHGWDGAIPRDGIWTTLLKGANERLAEAWREHGRELTREFHRTHPGRRPYWAGYAASGYSPGYMDPADEAADQNDPDHVVDDHGEEEEDIR